MSDRAATLAGPRLIDCSPELARPGFARAQNTSSMAASHV